MVLILFNGRMDAFPIIFRSQSIPSVVFKTDFRAVALALNNVNFEESINEDMIDL